MLLQYLLSIVDKNNISLENVKLIERNSNTVELHFNYPIFLDDTKILCIMLRKKFKHTNFKFDLVINTGDNSTLFPYELLIIDLDNNTTFFMQKISPYTFKITLK